MLSKISFISLIILFSFSCKERVNHDVSIDNEAVKVINVGTALEKDYSEPLHVEVVTADLPIRLDLIDFDNEHIIQQISDGKISRIEEEIEKYYFEDCLGSEDSPFSMKDIYLQTIQLSNDSNYLLYWVLFRHISGKINSKVLFFDRLNKIFLPYIHDLNIHALYGQAKEGKLKPTNMKELLHFVSPEIELVDYDGDKYSDFKFTRLYHNGTANALEETIIEIYQTKVDTLNVNLIWYD